MEKPTARMSECADHAHQPFVGRASKTHEARILVARTSLNSPAMRAIRFPFLAALMVLLTFSLSSCDAIGTIFKAGAWTGIIGVFLHCGAALVCHVLHPHRR